MPQLISYFHVDGAPNHAECSIQKSEFATSNGVLNSGNLTTVLLASFQHPDKSHYKMVGRRTGFNPNYIDPHPLRQDILIDTGEGDALSRTVNQSMTYIQRAK